VVAVVLTVALVAAVLFLARPDAPGPVDSPQPSTTEVVGSLFDQSRESSEVWLCPVHKDEQAVGPQVCPICQRDMVKRFLVSSYTCSMHTHIDQEEPGSCPICHMALVRVARELEWYCPDNPRQASSEPGVCSGSGTPLVARTIPLVHGDHNPRHGGQLFMAPTQTLAHHEYHHIEGVLMQEGEFRLYLYDDFTAPMGAGSFPYAARVGEQPLAAEPSETYLTTSLEPADSYPVEVVLHVAFPGNEGKESIFNFVFSENMGVELAELRVFKIPDGGEAIYREIVRRDEYLRDFMSRGAWTDLHVPALQAKDLTLALIETEGNRFAVSGKKLVQAAWLLDIFGDQGNREEVESVYARFESALRDIGQALGEESTHAP